MRKTRDTFRRFSGPRRKDVRGDAPRTGHRSHRTRSVALAAGVPCESCRLVRAPSCLSLEIGRLLRFGTCRSACDAKLVPTSSLLENYQGHLRFRRDLLTHLERLMSVHPSVTDSVFPFLHWTLTYNILNENLLPWIKFSEGFL